MHHADKIEAVKTYLAQYLLSPITVTQDEGATENTYIRIGMECRVVISEEFFDLDLDAIVPLLRTWRLAAQVRDDGKGHTFFVSKKGVQRDDDS